LEVEDPPETPSERECLSDKGRDGNQTWWICLRVADCSPTELRAQVMHEAREKGGCFGFGIAELDRNFGDQMRRWTLSAAYRRDARGERSSMVHASLVFGYHPSPRTTSIRKNAG
jgi:hypothetical protein